MIKNEAQKFTKLIVSPFECFLKLQSAGGILLLIAAAIALFAK